MRTIYKTGAIAGMILFMISCGGGSGNQQKEGNDLNAKKAELQKLRDQSAKLGDQIRKLEEEIGQQDSTFAVKPQLVSITAIAPQNFAHYIDLQGKITTENIYYVAPRNQGGQVKAVYVKEGDRISKGKLLLKLDDATIRQQIEQQKIRVSAADDLYRRRKNLWDQKIGAEIDLINAKNQLEGEQRQMDLLNEQLSFTNVYAEVGGVAEVVNVHVGEFFGPATAGTPAAGIQIVNDADLKATVDVPENYLPNVKKGTDVLIELQDTHKQYKSKISVISQLIDVNSRGFKAEAHVPSDPSLKPNQLITMKIKDYSASNTIVIPMTTLQTDENGKFVFVLVNDKGKQVAKKKPVTVGQIYGEQIEVKSGLAAGEQLITQGYQGIYEGQTITTQG